MSGFKKLNGSYAIVSNHKGTYAQNDLYSWDDYLFIKVGSGFVRINGDGSTSSANVGLVHLNYEGPLYKSKLNRLLIAKGRHKDTKALDSNASEKMLSIGFAGD